MTLKQKDLPGEDRKINLFKRLLVKTESAISGGLFEEVDAQKALDMLKCGADVNAINSEGKTPLIRAVERGAWDVAEVLVQNHAKLDAKNPNNGWTALMYAAHGGCKEAVEILIKAGAGLEIRDDREETALMLAALFDVHDSDKIIKMLIEAGANPQAVNDKDQTALMLAVVQGSVKTVGALVDAGADVNFKNNDGTTALMLPPAWAAEEIVDILSRGGAKVNEVDRHGDSVMYHAGLFDDERRIMALVEAGTDINQRDGYGKTELMRAIRRGDAKRVTLLINLKADLDIVDQSGLTALIIATMNEQPRMVKLLVDAGACLCTEYMNETALDLARDMNCTEIMGILEEAMGERIKTLRKKSLEIPNGLNARDESGMALLHWAVLLNEENMVRSLIMAKAELNAQDDYGQTALIHAIRRKLGNMAKLLVDANANLDIVDKHGRSALLWAMHDGQNGTIDLLIKRNADLGVRDKFGRTALIAAAENGNERMAKTLIEAGADLEAQDENGWTALELAAGHEHHDLVRLLSEAARKKDAPIADNTPRTTIRRRVGGTDNVRTGIDCPINARPEPAAENLIEELTPESAKRLAENAIDRLSPELARQWIRHKTSPFSGSEWQRLRIVERSIEDAERGVKYASASNELNEKYISAYEAMCLATKALMAYRGIEANEHQHMAATIFSISAFPLDDDESRKIVSFFSRARRIRNKLAHRFGKVTQEQAEEAVTNAEAFIKKIKEIEPSITKKTKRKR